MAISNANKYFPAFVRDLHVPADWDDISWGNDEAPSFLVAMQLRVWVNHPDVLIREGAPRFAVQKYNDNNEPEDDVYQTNDWANLIGYVEAQTNGTVLLAQFLANDADRGAEFLDDPIWDNVSRIVQDECVGETALETAALQIFSTADLDAVQRILNSDADECPVLTMKQQVDRIAIGRDIRRVADKMARLAETYEKELDDDAGK